MNANTLQVKDASAGYRATAEALDVPPGYKWTGVGVIPDDWRCEGLGMHCELVTKGTTPTSIGKRFTADGVHFLKAEAISDDGRTIPAKVAFIDETTHALLGRSQLMTGDLLISIAGVLGRVGRVEECDLPANTNQALAIVRLSRRSAIDRNFLFWCLRGAIVEKQICDINVQAAQANISLQNVRDFLLALPHASEQRSIAEALSDVDGLLGALEALIAKKRAIKQAAMQQLLTGKTRLPGFSGEWEMKRLGEIADVDSENLSSNTNPDYSFNYISLEQVDAGRLLGYSEEIFWAAPSRARRALRRGDVLMSTVRPNLMAHLFFREQASNAVCSTGFAVLRARDNLSDPGFLFAHLFGHVVNNQIEKTLAGSNYPAINSRDVKLIEIPCPPEVHEQTAIATVLSDMDAEITALECRRDKTRAIKQGMMQQLLTGRVRLVAPKVMAKQSEAKSKTSKSHSWAFNEAVVISMLAKQFGSERYPLGRMRYTKLSYLLHRHEEKQAEGYLKKAAGPYNPQTRYGGAEKIALDKGYVRKQTSGKFRGFVAADNSAQAESYFEKWYGPDCIVWLEQFRRKSNDDLEVLATVDMAAEELRTASKNVDTDAVKDVIRSHPEWQAKLNRTVFSDADIAGAVEACRILFN